jgi:hypothetical protein
LGSNTHSILGYPAAQVQFGPRATLQSCPISGRALMVGMGAGAVRSGCRCGPFPSITSSRAKSSRYPLCPRPPSSDLPSTPLPPSSVPLTCPCILNASVSPPGSAQPHVLPLSDRRHTPFRCAIRMPRGATWSTRRRWWPRCSRSNSHCADSCWLGRVRSCSMVRRLLPAAIVMAIAGA